MRVTFVLHFLGIVGGVRAVFECANRLIKRGHTVNIVHPLIPFRYTSEFSTSFIYKYTKDILSELKRGNTVPYNWFPLKADLTRVTALSPGIVNLFENQIPDGDAIIATSWETSYPVSRLSENKGGKFYFVQHYEIWNIWNNEYYWRGIDSRFNCEADIAFAMAATVPQDSLDKKIKRLVDESYKLPLKKITTSFWLKELIEKKFGEELYGRIDIGNNFEIFHKEQTPDNRSGKKRILMPYRGEQWKGDCDGLKALDSVKRNFPDVEIAMFGAKRDDKVPEWVKFHERISDAELRMLYTNSDIFVYPSWVEGWGSPPMEAMACGTACITTNVGGVPYYAVNDETALVVPPKNPAMLEKAVIRLLTDDTKRASIAQSGYDYIQQFTWDRTVDQLEKVLLESVKIIKEV